MVKPRTFTNFPQTGLEIKEKVKPEDNEQFQAWRAIYHGSYPEYLIFTQLERRGLVYGVDFNYQAAEMGGRQRFGGAVVDFELPDLHIAGRVQGEYWHLRERSTRENDIMQRLVLEGMGWTVVDMLAHEITTRPHIIARLFLEGRETPLAESADR